MLLFSARFQNLQVWMAQFPNFNEMDVTEALL